MALLYNMSMRVYFAGISGTGIGPLAELAQDAGHEVLGSDIQPGAIAAELAQRKIEVKYGPQDGEFLREKQAEAPIDWFVYTSALPADHPELKLAQSWGLRCSKRDEFLAQLVADKQLKMLAVAGTHGKTTTTALLIWTLRELGVPVSYAVGTTLGWAPSAHYAPDCEYFVYEADEYDRNFLAYRPELALITGVDYDHPDCYPTPEEYRAAFAQFESQANSVVKNTTIEPRISLVGELRRFDASLVYAALKELNVTRTDDEIIAAINRFPGAGRRFEEIAPGVFSDYGHHPAEIKATVKMAIELKEQKGFQGLAVVYEPHQNVRQHEIGDGYADAFVGADKIFWLPTYLTRERPDLDILTPEDLIRKLQNADKAEPAEMNDDLAQKLKTLQNEGWLVVLMTAGPADAWLRRVFRA